LKPGVCLFEFVLKIVLIISLEPVLKELQP
jgi:hypothetical protein